MKYGSLNLLQPAGPVQTCKGTVLPCFAYFSICKHQTYQTSSNPVPRSYTASARITTGLISASQCHCIIPQNVYLLTPWCRVLLEKLTGLQLVKKLPAFHGTQRFITALTSIRHLSLSWANPIQSIYPHPTSWSSILILSTYLHLGLPFGLFLSGFPTKTLYTPSPHPYVPISFFSILSPAQYWVRSTNHPRMYISYKNICISLLKIDSHYCECYIDKSEPWASNQNTVTPRHNKNSRYNFTKVNKTWLRSVYSDSTTNGSDDGKLHLE